MVRAASRKPYPPHFPTFALSPFPTRGLGPLPIPEPPFPPPAAHRLSSPVFLTVVPNLAGVSWLFVRGGTRRTGVAGECVTWTLEQLVDGLRGGDQRAVPALVALLEAPGRRLASALLGDTHAAEDAVQEAIIDAVRLIGTLREPRSLPGWFRQLVRTHAGRIARRRKESAGGHVPEPSANVPPPERQTELGELRARVRQALAELAPVGRETAELFYFGGLTLSEVADVLGIPLGTAKRRLHDARRQLREILVDWDGIT